jgi:hypothetical protein
MLRDYLRKKVAHINERKLSALHDVRHEKSVFDVELDKAASRFPNCANAINQIKASLQETFSLTERMLINAVPYHENLALLGECLAQLQNFCQQIDAFLNRGGNTLSELALDCKEFVENLELGLEEVTTETKSLAEEQPTRNRSLSDSMLPHHLRPSLRRELPSSPPPKLSPPSNGS